MDTPVPAAASVALDDGPVSLDDLVARVAAGQQVVLTRGGSPVARLVPAQPQPSSEHVIAEMRRFRERLGARGFVPLSAEDVIALRDEGRH